MVPKLSKLVVSQTCFEYYPRPPPKKKCLKMQHFFTKQICLGSTDDGGGGTLFFIVVLAYSNLFKIDELNQSMKDTMNKFVHIF